MKLFDKEEIRDLIIVIFALALIFSYPNIEELFFVSLIIVFISFFLHEMGHKFLATRLDCTATFKMWPFGILVGLVTMFLPVKFLAPGFVEIVPYKFGRWGIKVIRLTPRDLGQIALAGVGVNILFAWLFALIGGNALFQTLAQINAWLALFNLFPFPPLDGSKIFLWNIWVWLFLSLLTIFAFVII